MVIVFTALCTKTVTKQIKYSRVKVYLQYHTAFNFRDRTVNCVDFVILIASNVVHNGS